MTFVLLSLTVASISMMVLLVRTLLPLWRKYTGSFRQNSRLSGEIAAAENELVIKVDQIRKQTQYMNLEEVMDALRRDALIKRSESATLRSLKEQQEKILKHKKGEQE